MIYLLSGDEYEVDQKLKELKKGKKTTLFDLSEDMSDLKTKITEVSLFDEPKIYVLKNPKKLKDADKLIDLIEKDFSGPDVVIVSDLAKNSRIIKAVKEVGEVFDYKTTDVSSWASNQAKQRGINLNQAQIKLVIDRVGEDKIRLTNEFDKLEQFDEIDEELIENVVANSFQGNIFDLLDAIANNNDKKTAEIYDELIKQPVAPQELIGLINWQLNMAAIYLEAKDKNLYDVAKDLKVSAYGLKKSAKIADKLNKNEMKQIYQKLLDIDQKIKSSSNAELLLKNYILNLF